jgi:hypothetical protein
MRILILLLAQKSLGARRLPRFWAQEDAAAVPSDKVDKASPAAALALPLDQEAVYAAL